MTKFAIIENAKRQARMCFLGIAIPCDKKTVDGTVIRSEKVLKFNRKALRNLGKSKADSVDPRFIGGADRMIMPIGKPGSRERVETLILRYAMAEASGQELSPFSEE